MKTSKEAFDKVILLMEEFELQGTEWTATGNLSAVSAARKSGKQVMKAMRNFVKLSVKEGKERAYQIILAERADKKAEEVVEVVIPEPVEEILIGESDTVVPLA